MLRGAEGGHWTHTQGEGDGAVGAEMSDGATSQGCRQLEEAGRTLPRSPEGAPPCTPLDVSPVVPTLDCQPPELLCYQLLVVIAAVGN